MGGVEEIPEKPSTFAMPIVVIEARWATPGATQEGTRITLNWKLFALTFTTLFLAEMGDKTQLAVFTLVAQHRMIVPVFLGASLALSTVSLIGALFGGVVSRYLPAEYLQAAAGVLFIGLGAFILVQAFSKIAG